MSGGRWKYRTEQVTVDGNTVEVRGLTYGERLKFAQYSRDARAGKEDRQRTPGVLLKMGCVGLADEEIDAMPAELIESATNKILELSGINVSAAGADDAAPGASLEGAGESGQEKKAP